MRHKAFREGLRRAARRRRLEALAELAEQLNELEEPRDCRREKKARPLPDLEGFCGVSSAFNPRPDDSVDIEPETTADNQTLSAIQGDEKDDQ